MHLDRKQGETISTKYDMDGESLKSPRVFRGAAATKEAPMQGAFGKDTDIVLCANASVPRAQARVKVSALRHECVETAGAGWWEVGARGVE